MADEGRMNAFTRGLLVGIASMFLVVSSCHPFPCRAGVIGNSVFMVCR